MALQITFFQKLFSYILPVSILKTKSEFNSSLEVTVENGKLVLNSANANYSYGSLFKIFKKAFVEFNVAPEDLCEELLSRPAPAPPEIGRAHV